ncbi:MAG: hypothetical protein L3J03_00555 [Desulfobacterales bacterium]|nr:hypothetical protein [Desulfobacterales bacterium]
MAEIKSTMEKVLERLARMDAAPLPPAELAAEETVKQGMRLAADYLRDNTVPLARTIAEQEPDAQQLMRRGAVQALLRNIILPRDDDSQAADMAMVGVIDLAAGAGELVQTMGEMRQVLEQYKNHRNDLRRQLEEAIRQQMEQAMAEQTGQSGPGMQLDPVHHPKFMEEWQRIIGELNNQYGKALDQYKDLIGRRLA